MNTTPRNLDFGKMAGFVYTNEQEMAEAAAENTAETLIRAVDRKGEARVIVATGNSQLAFVEALKKHTDIPWDRITAFHMDEYIGIPEDHPASFRLWIKNRIEDVFSPRAVHYIDGNPNRLHETCLKYETMLKEKEIDLVCMGIGENGHIAFNDPPVADFEDPLWIKVVKLDEACRRQQAGEGHFPDFDSVPKYALSLTVPALLSPGSLQIVVPESRKAEAVLKTYRDEISTACPATILRTTAKAKLYLDNEASQLLPSTS